MTVLPVALASALALVSLGGGLYEFLVVDPSWPRRPEIIQPARGGISRKRFWIPAHVAFELILVVNGIKGEGIDSCYTLVIVGINRFC